jgi:16S rRNA (guanine527-N7)-methyltransferase
MPSDAVVADVGSGAGLPGIPVAVMLPRHSVVLIERSVKKCGFLHRAVEVADLRNTRILAKDLREVSEQFDVLLLRAVAGMDRGFYDLLRRRITAEGRIVLYKGRRSVVEEELERIGLTHGKRTVHQLSVPGLDAERHLVEIRPGG